MLAPTQFQSVNVGDQSPPPNVWEVYGHIPHASGLCLHWLGNEFCEEFRHWHLGKLSISYILNYLYPCVCIAKKTDEPFIIMLIALGEENWKGNSAVVFICIHPDIREDTII